MRSSHSTHFTAVSIWFFNVFLYYIFLCKFHLSHIPSLIPDIHIVQLVKLLYDYGLVDHTLTRLQKENAGKESLAHENLHVDVERVLDIRIFTRHFILR